MRAPRADFRAQSDSGPRYSTFAACVIRPHAVGRMSVALEAHLAELRSRGYTMLEGVLTPAEVAAARAALEAIFRREERVGRRRGWHNEVYRAAYMLPQKHPLFRSFCQREPLLSLMRAALGARCVLGSLNGLAMTPGGRDQALHIDQEETVPGMIVCVNALHTLDDFRRENGCTRVVPGSQDRIWTGDAAAVERAEAEAVYVEAPAGSLVAYSGGVWHGGSRNRTAAERRAVHAFFAREWMRPHWDFPRSLSPDVAATLTEEQRQLFGFDSRSMRYDVRANRIRRQERLPGRLARWWAAVRRRA
jgi:ectoine hydroxylase-related dioxygenase (phytanoyl-CoA dioxygenase family)